MNDENRGICLNDMAVHDEKTGGPAFPQAERIGEMSITSGGMTLRDYFAAKVMASTIAVPEYMRAFASKGKDFEQALAALAEDSYKAADAMLKERAK